MKEKKKKLNLDELEVQSFVTSFDSIGDETAGIKGGYTHECASEELGCTCCFTAFETACTCNATECCNTGACCR